MAQSKHNEYLPGYKPSQVIHHEWRTAENSAGYLLPTLRSMREKNPKLQFLDVGAGSGTISVGFAQHLPEGEVTVTDLSGEILRRAEGFAAAAGLQKKNMKFQQANAYELPFPDASFDVTHCHQMLCHMDAPSDALREMLRVTRPGGVVAARESDLATQCIWPESPGLRRFFEVTEGIFKVAGTCWTGGRQLLSWALKAGATRDQIQAGFGTWRFTALEDKNVWATAMAERIRNGEMRKKGVELGLITHDDQVEEMATAWEEWAKQDDATLGMLHGEIIIQK
ncbi:hypothetical protein SLS62_000640 [Diatrype stigma]|uniref:Methyltransferase type 11 domain-containing protein n=1 Tax=Diatrype stigma TaxID=117547 RepID=A0AAN9UZA8_9PEZI